MNKTADSIYRERKEFFNEHAGKWHHMWYRDEDTGRFDKHEKDFERLFSMTPLKPGDHVLDVGCGTGILAPMLLERTGPTGIIYELDFAEKMLEENKRLHKAQNIRFVRSDAEDAPLGEASCDAVICFSCFPHFHDKEKAAANLARILKRRGIFVISHFASSEEINEHHRSCQAVMHDHLPHTEAVEDLLQRNGLTIDAFIDEPGFYLILAGKGDKRQ